jgi:S1-C subfamily serine protease
VTIAPGHGGWILAISFALATAAGAATTEEVFQRHAAGVVQIRVTAKGSGAKAVIGTGFVVRPDTIVTNYHVVSNVILHPERYVAEVVARGGKVTAGHIAGLDVVSDLAVLTTSGGPATTSLTLAKNAPLQGARLYALGHPHDLGLSIVEGTYNGPLEHSLYEHLHFTGSLNPGMSGGPTITPRGEVVGVNVRTAGNQVSFLVPVGKVRALVGKLGSAKSAARPWIEVVREQLLENEARYFSTLMAADPLPTITLDGVVLPGQIAPFMKCWANNEAEENKPYRAIRYDCSTDDYVFISDQLLSGVVQYHHHVARSDELNPFQFSTLMSQYFGSDYGDFVGTEDDVTSFRCRERLLRSGDLPLKAVVCLRAYRRLPGLHDAVLKVVVLGGGTRGAESSLAMSGVSSATVQKVVQRYLGAIGWTE